MNLSRIQSAMKMNVNRKCEKESNWKLLHLCMDLDVEGYKFV